MNNTITPDCFIIGFSGRKNSGKDTCATSVIKYILAAAKKAATEIPQEKIVETFAFANPMKRMCMQFFGLTQEQCFGTNDQKNSPTEILWENFPVREIAEQHDGYMTAREVAQFLGTEVIRRMLPNAHVNALMWDINFAMPHYALVVDVRFPNEVRAIQDAEGKVIRLTRVVFPDDNHESETALDPEFFDWRNFDAILDNRALTPEEQELFLKIYLKKWGVL